MKHDDQDEHLEPGSSKEHAARQVSNALPAILSNEFAFVELDIIRYGNGERLSITSPSRGTTSYVDPVVLQAISSMDAEELRSLVTRNLDQ
ncbi:hypothetical protein [Nocardia sp. R6R-6]|uniref:hypothetical protein n=1 Tax=Nocardia sp. R6R-6 TaxID=3459303 RepID=UPI00403DD94D